MGKVEKNINDLIKGKPNSAICDKFPLTDPEKKVPKGSQLSGKLEVEILFIKSS
jgi:hypothetical protein